MSEKTFPADPFAPIAQIGLWHWLDDVELTAFEGHDGDPVFLRWQHNDRLVRKNDLKPGDHVLFDQHGYVLEIARPKTLSIADQQQRKRLLAPWAYPGR